MSEGSASGSPGDELDRQQQSGDEVEVDDAEVLDPESLPPEVVTKIAARFFSGPLPSPDLLREYDDVVPGCAERIIGWTEKEGDHRRSVEQTWVSSRIVIINRGQIFAFVIAIVGILCGTYLVSEGHERSGVALFAGDLVIIVLAFLPARGKDDDNDLPDDDTEDEPNS